MKKVLTRSTALVLGVLMCLSLAACGKANLESYVKKNQDTLNAALASQIDSSIMSVEVTAEKNTLIYNYTYKLDVVELLNAADMDEVKEIAANNLDAGEADMLSTLSSLQSEISSLEAIRVNFYAQDGSLIATKDYK